MKKEIEIQGENVGTLLKLAKDNPELRIVAMVDNECVPSDDWGWWVANIGESTIDEICTKGERIYVRSWDEDDMVDNLIDHSLWDEDLSEDEIKEMAENRVAAYDWENVILLKIQV